MMSKLNLILSLYALGCSVAEKATYDCGDDCILLESFASDESLHEWQEMNDPVMGGQSEGTFEIKSGTGVMSGQVKIVSFLNAPGFIKAETKADDTPWPDISTCTGIRFRAKSCTDYTGYRISFGHEKPPNAFPYIYGYKSNLDLPQSTEMMSVDIPFHEFSYDWDAGTGDQRTTCEENPDNCPSEKTLENLYSIAVWGEGVEGDAHLMMESIFAYGCNSDAVKKSHMNLDTDKKKTVGAAINKNELMMEDDEIIIEDFSNPKLEWTTLNDPVMGGQSSSSVSMEDGIAKFVGEVAIVPFLHAPGFIQMINRGGTYPDASSCSTLKLVLKADKVYTGYRVSFGNVHLPGGNHAFGYKADFDAPVQDDFATILLPFTSFSSNWDEKTGDIKVSCQEDSQYCVDEETLSNFQTMALWGEGIEGNVDLSIKSISAVGCNSGDNGSTSYDPLSTTRTAKANVHDKSYLLNVGSITIFAVMALIAITAFYRSHRPNESTKFYETAASTEIV